MFLSLDEVADNLPPLEEECLPVRMDAELERAYRNDVERPLRDAIKEMMRRKVRRLLGAMLQTLLAYPDLPFNWRPVGYSQDGQFVTVTIPPDLPKDVIRPKEQALIDLVNAEKTKGRKVWVYVQYTDRHDVQGRLERLLTEAGFQVGVLRSSVPLSDREDWIAANAPHLDVVVSHPRLVETGLDLFDKARRHNFPTICFYETGYNLFTLRQASRRSWRIGQMEPCRIVYLFYEKTMQERAMSLMGKKLTAARARRAVLHRRVGRNGRGGRQRQIALARSLVERLDEGDVRRHWSRTLSTNGQIEVIPPANGRCLWPDMIASRRRDLPIQAVQTGGSRTATVRRSRSVRRAASLLF